MKIKRNQKKFFFFLALSLVAGVFFFVAPASAGAEWAGEMIGAVIGWIISALGIIMVLVIKALVAVAQYNNFINSQAVVNGWHIVRDVCNMFFVVILLIIAFATILNQEKYSYKTWLPKLILMAVLINFSKTICGLLIDVTQVVMLTFVNAFKGMAAGNLISNLGILEVVTLANNSSDIGFWAIVGAYVLGLFYMIIALVVIVTMLAMLVMRMVMIWVYVVLSPAAYLLSAFPGGQKYSGMWWSEFTKNLIVGPVLAFFIWLSFTSLQSYSVSDDFKIDGSTNTESMAKELTLDPNESYGAKKKGNATTKAGELDVFLKFIISIGMLIGGLKISSEIGGAAGGIAGKGMAKIQQGASWAGKRAKSGAKNLGIAAINQKSVRRSLDVIGSQKGIIGGALRATGVRSLAQKGSIALGSHKSEVEEKAKKKVSALKKAGASRTVATIASEQAFTMSQKAAKKEARKVFVVPVERFDKTKGRVGLDADGQLEAERRIKDLDLKTDAPSSDQITQLGKAGINLDNVPKFREYLKKNSEARGAYNTGQLDAGLTDFVVGTDRRNVPLTGPGALGTLITNPDDVDKAIGRKGDNAYAFREKKVSSEGEFIDALSEGNYSLRDSRKTAKKSSSKVDEKNEKNPEVLQQRERIKNITGAQDMSVIEATRSKINDWNIADNKDHFQDSNQIKEAYTQISNEQKVGSQKNKFETNKSVSDKISSQSAYQEKMTKPGSGSLSINRFARGQQDYVGLDFNKLDPEVQNKMKGSLKAGNNLDDVKGVTVSYKDEIKKISKSLVEIINQEINALKNKNINKEMSKSDSHRLKNLNDAKQKFQDPKKIENLELINSSAKGYNSINDVKETIIHEDLHGKQKLMNEDAVSYIANKSSIDGTGIETRQGGAAYVRHLEEYMLNAAGVKTTSTKSASKIIELENNDDDYNDYDLRTRVSAETSSGDDITNITNITNNVSEEKEKIKNNFRNNQAATNGNTFMVFYFNRFIKSLNKLSSTISKKEKNTKNATNSPSPSSRINRDNDIFNS